MDKITKFLRKLGDKELDSVLDLLSKIKSGDTHDLHIKKLKGFKNIFRLRSGDIRILYRDDDRGGYDIIDISRRNESTYKF